MSDRESVLRIDDAGKRAAAARQAKPLIDRFALSNDPFVELTPPRAPNMLIDRMPGVGGKP